MARSKADTMSDTPKDAFDPGEHGNYPYWPRPGDGATTRMPTGLHWQLTPAGDRVLVDLTPRHIEGVPIVPPDLHGE
jgi:hypothetical protein